MFLQLSISNMAAYPGVPSRTAIYTLSIFPAEDASKITATRGLASDPAARPPRTQQGRGYSPVTNSKQLIKSL
ncbi:hypothetical protein Q8A67_009933 [Cirrhinus molitorella]|uniref:Uncharacterized protein n=1 Tax=Cirrhinus molitorella TaxID=172907 RepID=A0AA88TNT1_9TELE|nr:hypothetical protein Q8A67_009933 [Cirrhinus molitorella]